MAFKTLLRAGSASALAAALSFGAAPALAQDTDGEPGYSRQAHDRAERAQARQERQAQRAEAVQQREQRQAQAPAAQPQSGRDWNRGDRRSDTGAERAGRDWNRRDNSNNDWGQARAAQAQAQAEARQAARAQAQAQGQLGDRSQQWDGRRRGGISGSSNTGANTGGWERNRSYGDRDRNRTYRDGYRDGRQRDAWQDRNQQQNAYRSGYRDGVRTDGYRDGQRRYSGDYRRWSHDWRRDNRYNWYSYRNQFRDRYRLGRYYSPYGNYRYNRLSIGFRLGSLFYGSRYWINDPWQYRLPEAYGPYRWVRYYDDALLVDIYTGEVVDVIYDFFW